jgi:CIC family chloride channel protein
MNYDSKDPSRRSNNYWLASSRLLLIASMIGIGTGLASIAFKVLIEIINGLFFIQSSRVLKSLLGEYYLILLPALGGLLAGSIVYFWGREKGGYGVSEVMAVVDQDGIMKAGPVWAKTFASAVTIGSGGSAGLHGPIVHIGSSKI